MFGNDVVTICPYCKKKLYQNIGITNYYKYKHNGDERMVRIESHCGKQFITEDQEAHRIVPIRYDIPRECNRFIYSIREYIYNIPEDEFAKYDIDTLTNKVIDYIRSEFDPDMVERNIDNIKMLVQITESTMHFTVFTAPLTDEVKASLEYNTTICW